MKIKKIKKIILYNSIKKIYKKKKNKLVRKESDHNKIQYSIVMNKYYNPRNHLKSVKCKYNKYRKE